MNYAWVETLVMVLIFIAAALFAIKHLLPELYVNVCQLFARKNNRVIDINLVAVSSASSCQTKCSACNGCSK
jgi:type IV secretory pathway VirB3-like protein